MMLAQNLVLMGIFFTIPLFLQIVQGLDALETGVRMLPTSVGLFVSAIVGSSLATRFAPRTIRWTRVYGVAEVVFLLAIAFGTPYYRCAGHRPEDSFNFNLRYDSPMFRELNIQQTCPWPMNVPGGWWPDVLPKPGE